jgi:1,4-dihydroxy-2-naphthoyl-CoA hydrolase
MGHPGFVGVETVAERLAIIERTGSSGFAGLLGMTIERYNEGRLLTRLQLRDECMLHAGGLLHAGTVFGLADTTAGWGCLLALPDHAKGFTTIEGKVNFIATTSVDDALTCEAWLAHAGRTTQVWDAEVRRVRDGRILGLYRCTQALLSERRSGSTGSK